MGDVHPETTADLIAWIGRRRTFFAASGVAEGSVDVSRRSARQIVRLSASRGLTSCGDCVPLFDFKAERPNPNRWADAKTDEEPNACMRTRNARRFDSFGAGLPMEA